MMDTDLIMKSPVCVKFKNRKRKFETQSNGDENHETNYESPENV